MTSGDGPEQEPVKPGEMRIDKKCNKVVITFGEIKAEFNFDELKKLVKDNPEYIRNLGTKYRELFSSVKPL